MLKAIKNIFLFTLVIILFTNCEEDFDIVTEYKDQTVIYGLLNHKDPWDPSGLDTNWIVVNKAFLGEASVPDMAGVADSVNYPDYDAISVTLQRINSLDPKSGIYEGSDPLNNDLIVLKHTTHYKKEGFFARDENVVFYTTKALMYAAASTEDPTPSNDINKQYYYKLSVKKPGQAEVYATTKMIRGITVTKGLLARPAEPINRRELNLSSSFPNYSLTIDFESNIDARLYDVKLRIFYYEKRTDGNIYLDYVDYQHPLMVTNQKAPVDPIVLAVNISPGGFYAQIASKLHDVSDVVWRIPKLTKMPNFSKYTHSIIFTLGDHNTYVYNLVTQPSNGIVQEKPSYTNITNGLGLFASTWNWKRDKFFFNNGTIDSLSMGASTKNVKFKNQSETEGFNITLDASTIIISDRVKDLDY